MKQHELPIIELKFLKHRSLLALVNNSVMGGDNHLFRNIYAKDESGKEIDILEDGKNSCATFVSWILLAVELIKRPHATIEGTEKDLTGSGWYLVQGYRKGAVLIWKSITGELLGQKNIKHRHIGFCVGNDEAVSNNTETGFPQRHHVTYGGSREVEKVYWHKDLDE